MILQLVVFLTLLYLSGFSAIYAIPLTLAFIIISIFKHYSPQPRHPLPSEKQYISSTGKLKFPSIFDEPTVDLSIVIPAYNEKSRLPKMLDETLQYMKSQPGTFEIIIVDDGSNDSTTPVGLKYAKSNPEIKVMTLAKNRGKGGAVCQGIMVSSGKQILFADADGATKFADLKNLQSALTKITKDGLGMAIGSRAHLVNSEAVVKRSFLRNFLMKCFHLLLYVFAIQSIKDTQCGFKLLTRKTAQLVVPKMHIEGWIFDVEMILLCQKMGAEVVEVGVDWQEIEGTKLSVLRDSIQMGVQLFVIRVNYFLKIWS